MLLYVLDAFFECPEIDSVWIGMSPGRPQGLARTVNKDAQEPPSDELKVDEFIAQARERLFNGQL